MDRRKGAFAMTHPDPRMQELVELLHGAIRSLSDREVVYDVVDRLAYYTLSVKIQARYLRISIDREVMYSQRWADMKHRVVRQFITNWYEQMPVPVRAEDIKYMMHPCAEGASK
jgi:hypothetical protein